MSNKPVVRVIGTGGTIATVTDNRMDFTNYPETGRRIPVEESLARIPETGFIADVRCEDLMSEASSNIGPEKTGPSSPAASTGSSERSRTLTG